MCKPLITKAVQSQRD